MKYLTCIFLIFLIGCGLFETRDSESPHSNSSTFVPPTSANIVVENLRNSILDKNPDNYVACLFNNPDSDLEYSFMPSTQASAVYQSIFDNWQVNDERLSFLSMTSNLPTELKPDLIWSNARYEVLLPDSAVYVADYYLNIPHNSESIAKSFSGTMQLTIIPETGGLWSIIRWIDRYKTSDTLETWSFAKAQFYN